MQTFKPGDVVRVPFPYVETPFHEVRPALVVSTSTLGPNQDLLWAVMITSATNRGWPGDVSVETDHQTFGLPAPSLIRTEKIAVFEAGMASLLGRVSGDILADVQARMAGYLELTLSSDLGDAE
jgi:mRNA interferase MazF